MNSVCHVSDSDSLLVCSFEINDRDFWLVLLSREGSEWRETHRVQTAADHRVQTCYPLRFEFEIYCTCVAH